MMSRQPAMFIIFVLLFAAGTFAAEALSPVEGAATLEQLAWLAGHWQGGTDGRVTEELWLPPAGGLMLGLNRDVGPDGTAFFEYLRIEQTAEGIYYVASPRGGKTTRFRLVTTGDGRALFENPDHDFPQRITYRLTGPDTLDVTISGETEGEAKAIGWTWTRLSSVSAADGGKKP